MFRVRAFRVRVVPVFVLLVEVLFSRFSVAAFLRFWWCVFVLAEARPQPASDAEGERCRLVFGFDPWIVLIALGGFFSCGWDLGSFPLPLKAPRPVLGLSWAFAVLVRFRAFAIARFLSSLSWSRVCVITRLRVRSLEMLST